MNTTHYFGTSDNPQEAERIYYDTCNGDGAHAEIIFVVAILTSTGTTARGTCPACAGASTANMDRQMEDHILGRCPSCDHTFTLLQSELGHGGTALCCPMCKHVGYLAAFGVSK